MGLLAVHLSDGSVATPWLLAGFVGAALLLFLASRRMRDEEIPRIGVLTAAFFAGSAVHIPLTIVPTSVHLILNGLVGVILGRRAALAIAAGLLLQYPLAHGGLSTLGLNICIVGLPAVAASHMYPLLQRLGVSAFTRGAWLGAGASAATVTLDFLVLFLGGKDDFQTLAKFVLLANVPVVVVEGIMLGVIVRYLERVKPDMLGAARGVPGEAESGR